MNDTNPTKTNNKTGVNSGKVISSGSTRGTHRVTLVTSMQEVMNKERTEL